MQRLIVCLCVAIAVSILLTRGMLAQDQVPLGFVTKLGIDVDVRSGARILADETSVGTVILPDQAGAVGGGPLVPQIQLRGGNVQVNDPSLDNVQIFPGFRPFVHATQSEVSVSAFNRSIVATYNDSTGIRLGPSPKGLVYTQVMISRYSVSTDGGKTWSTALMPPAAGANATYGDPSLGADRFGNFYFATLGESAAGNGAIQVNRSLDGGVTWSDAAIVQEDNASDKEWLAVGPDPRQKSRDNVYVTWTSFQAAACELRLGRSTDGGVTWSAKTIFVPTKNQNPAFPQNCLQASNPTVDRITGRLYVPFLRYSNSDQDFIQMLVSDDAGETFELVRFNVPNAPDATVIPITQPGALTACGGSNLRLTIHTAANAGPGRFGLPRYINASRIIDQPTIAASGKLVYLAWSNSTSQMFGDALAGSDILLMRSADGGKTWSTATQVNPPIAADTQHVMPSLAIDPDPRSVHVTYYTQHANGSVDLDMANSLDGATSFPTDRTARVSSTSFDLPPTNIPLSNGPAFAATNYDRSIAVCYALGEYQSATTANGSVYAGWGDSRNQITEPVNNLDPISGQTHPQQDVFVQKVKAQ